MKDFGVEENCIAFQKFDFHSKYVLIEKELGSNLNNLIDKEEEWLTVNLEPTLSNNPIAFKNTNFIKETEKNYKISIGNKRKFIFGIISGFFFCFLVFIPLLFYNKISQKFGEGIFIGFLLKSIYFIINLYFFERLTIIY